MDKKELEILIPSETVRQYVLDTGWTFTDMQKAALLYHSDLPLEQQYSWLRTLRAKTDNEGLRKQLTVYLDREEQGLQAFKENNDKSHIYALTIKNDDEDQYNQIPPCDYFFDWELAYEYGKRKCCPFQIEKWGVQGAGVNSDHYAVLSFNRNGEIMEFQDRASSSDDNDLKTRNEHFEHILVEVPNPFERGDIVRFVDTEDVGIVETMQKEWKKDLARYQSDEWKQKGFCTDLLDVRIRVGFLNEDGTFSHRHIIPIYLEQYKPEEDWNKASPMDKLLLCASDLYRGEGSLDELCFFTTEYRNSKEG